MKTLESRILDLEKSMRKPAGTSLTRILKENSGIGWSFGFGQMGMPKKFYLGDTIEEVISKAENDANE